MGNDKIIIQTIMFILTFTIVSVTLLTGLAMYKGIVDIKLVYDHFRDIIMAIITLLTGVITGKFALTTPSNNKVDDNLVTNTDVLPPPDLVLPPETTNSELNNQVNSTDEKVINIQHATINVYDVVDISKKH